ncbi:MAG: citrate synthase/methylcitrate synthase [Deltaproteobacteria bacterium]|nr:MAG: citrate synthase/methylcitrate synthase [Deltaproteobacteria bacterium]
MSTLFSPGLAGVVAAESAVSFIDGESGVLAFRGRPVHAVASLGFEAAAAWVLDAPVAGLGEARVRAWRRQRGLPVDGEPMGRLRALVAATERGSAVDLIAEVGVAVARIAAGGDAARPDPARPHAEDLLRMATGSVDPARVRGLSHYLCTVMDHGLNASTFAARVVASTGSDTVSAVTAGIGALAGPLHGGAPGPVLDMLDAAGEAPEAWLRAELDAGRRIMGMGHRVYRVRDPRAAVLEQGLEGLHAGRVAQARRVEVAAEALLAARHPDRPLRANVEFYTAVLLDAVGLDRAHFTCWFAAGRVVGWLAHIDEERAVGRIVRPRARYVGPPLPSSAA